MRCWAGFFCFGRTKKVKGRTLRIARLRLGLRQQDVAEIAGFSRSRVGQVEQLRKVPRLWVDRYRRALALGGPVEPRITTKVVADSDSDTAKEAGRGATQPSD